jgi:hypothetical protein
MTTQVASTSKCHLSSYLWRAESRDTSRMSTRRFLYDGADSSQGGDATAAKGAFQTGARSNKADAAECPPKRPGRGSQSWVRGARRPGDAGVRLVRQGDGPARNKADAAECPPKGRAAAGGRGCEARAAPATQAYVSYVEETGRAATKQMRPNAAAQEGMDRGGEG